ncbi:hypothetical protein [Mumia quercus]|uniref:hypothetical protein n=1 Tax=Mumia quercus TaxID=2976125 RepID=UPI0021D147E2|nr:hypothetical protein [Mumia quercus]
MTESQPRLPLAHVIAHDGSVQAQRAFEQVGSLTEETILVFREEARPPAVTAEPAVSGSPVPTLTVDRIMRIARASGAAFVTIPSSLFSAERVLLSAIDAVARLTTDAWPAVTVQVLRGIPDAPRRNVLVVASHGHSSGALLLVATVAALLNGATLTKLVVGGGSRDERVEASVRRADADLAAELRVRYDLPVRYLRLPRRVDSLSLERVVSRLDADLVVTGMGRMAPGLSYRDLSREGRRKLLSGPLRVEHAVLRSTPADAILVIDGARLRRRPRRVGEDEGLGWFFVGDLGRLDEVLREQRQDWNQAAEFGSR